MNRFTIRSVPAVLSAAAAMLVLPACSSNNPQAKTEHAKTASYQPGVPGSISVETSTVTAYVVSVFDGPREIVLDLPGGKREPVTCGPEVANFDQIHPGDRVKATVTREVAVAMGTESDPPDTTGDSAIALAPKGARPGAVMATVRQVTATVTAIDLGRHTATLEFPDGQTRTVAVRQDIDLSKRKVGEKVVIRKTDALALRVEKVDKKG